MRAHEALHGRAKQLTAMHQRHGETPGKTCGECAHLVSRQVETARPYLKCEAYGVSSGAGTDFRRKWPACGLFEQGLAR